MFKPAKHFEVRNIYADIVTVKEQIGNTLC